MDRQDGDVRITARVDYAVRAALELAAVAPEALTAERIATAQQIPIRFLQAILRDLHGARLVVSQRGREGGYRLACPQGDQCTDATACSNCPSEVA